MAKDKKALKKKIAKPGASWSIPLNKKNFLIFCLGLLILIIGFYLMTIPPWDSNFALIISPIILLFGYLVLFPLGILKKDKKEN